MMGALQQRKLSHLFNMMDANGDGFLEESDFTTYVRRYSELNGIAIGSAINLQHEADTLAWWQGLRQAADQSRDERVSREEWLGFWSAVDDAVAALADQEPNAALEQIKQSGLVAARLADADGDGKITAEEYSRELRAYGQTVDVNTYFSRLDLDGDGHLTYDEISQLVKDFILSNDPEAPGNYLYGPYFAA